VATPFFDVWAADDLLGTALGELTQAHGRQYQDADQALGSGQFTINRHDAQAAWCTPRNLVRVRLEAGGPWAADDPRYVGAFFIEESSDTALSSDEEGGEVLERGGRVAVSMLQRAVLYPTAHFSGDEVYASTVPATGEWTLLSRGPGEVLRVLLRNADARSPSPLEPLTHSFTTINDSAGDPWPDTDTDWKLRVGQNYLELLSTLSSGGVYWRCGADLVLHAYEEHPGEDRSADVVFRKGEALAGGDGPIVESAERQLHASPAVSRVIVEGTIENNAHKYREVTNATVEAAIGRVEGYAEYKPTPTDSRLERAGQAAIRKAHNQYQGPTTLRVVDEEGRRAFVDYFPGDSILVDIPGVFDEQVVRVARITLEEDEAGNADPVLDLLASPFDPATAGGLFGEQGEGTTPGGRGCGDCPEPTPYVPTTDDEELFATLYAPSNLGRAAYPWVIFRGDGDDPPAGYAEAALTGPVEYVDALVSGDTWRRGIRFLGAATGVTVRVKASMVEVLRGDYTSVFTLSVNGGVVWTQSTPHTCAGLCGFTDNVEEELAGLEFAAGDVLTLEAFWTYGAQSVVVPAGAAGGWLEVSGSAQGTTPTNSPTQGQEVREGATTTSGEAGYGTNFAYAVGSLAIYAEGVRIPVAELDNEAGTWELDEALPAGTRLLIVYQALNGTYLGTGNVLHVGAYLPLIPYPLLGEGGDGSGSHLLADYQRWVSGGGGGGSSSCCPPDDPVDRALASPAMVHPPANDPAYVQVASGLETLTGNLTVTLGATPTPGNYLLALVALRDSAGVVPSFGVSGWELVDDGVTEGFAFTGSGAGDWPSFMYRRLVQPGDPAAWFVSRPSGIIGMALVELEASALAKVAVSSNATTAGTVAITPATSDPVIVVSFVAVRQDSALAFTPATDMTEVLDTSWATGDNGPQVAVNYRVISTPSGAYTVGSTYSGTPRRGVIAAAFSGVAPTDWSLLAPEAVDGDDATYVQAVGTEVLRLDLGAAYEIVRARLRIATATAGARSYELYGANEADYSDAVLVATLEFTATGSLTAQDVEALWQPAGAFRYWQLDGDNETRRVHSLELRELAAHEVVVDDPTTGSPALLQEALDNLEAALVTDHPDLTGRSTANQHPAAAVSFDDTGLGITAADVQGALEALDAAVSAGGIPSTIVDVKGDLIVATAADTVARLAAGANGRRLKANSGEATGLEWVADDVAVTVVIDGAAAEIADNVQLWVQVPFAWSDIVAARALADQSGSIVVDVWKDTYANYPPADADSITASAPVTISSATKSEDTTLTGWTKTGAAGDILKFNVDSCTTITKCTIVLVLRRS
jgi:hypothetical protein